MNHLIDEAVEPLIEWLRLGYSLCISLSWGKDSTAVLVLTLEAMKRAKAAGIDVPQCFAITSDTTIENPALGVFFEVMSGELERFCVLNGLPFEYIRVEPPLSASFFYVTVGRGKLPRYPGMSRDCSQDWKINPIIKAKKELAKQHGKPIISLVGTRFSESAEREQRMIERGDEAGKILTNPDGDRVTGKPKEIMSYGVSQEMEIDKTEAVLWLEHFINHPIAIDCTGYDPQEAIKFYLHNKIVTFSKGQPAAMDEIIQRSEMWSRLQLKLNVPDIQAYALEHSISDDEHCALKGEYPVEFQYDLFREYA